MAAVIDTGKAPAPAPAPTGKRVDELLDIALALFVRKDFRAVSVKELARASGISTSLIYYYFEDKRHLFDAAAEHAIAKTQARYRALVREHESPVERIEDWFAVNVAMQDSLCLLVRIMFNYARQAERSGLVEEKIAAFYDFERSLLAESIAAGKAQALFRCADPHHVARFVSIHLDGVFHAAMVQRGFDLAEAIADLKRALWQLLDCREAAGARPRPGRGHR